MIPDFLNNKPVGIQNIKLENFKSFRSLDIDLKPINILIGANGAGKSNFIAFFKFLQQILRENLSNYTLKKGGVNSFLYFGNKVSKFLKAEIFFNTNAYHVELAPTERDTFLFAEEKISYLVEPIKTMDIRRNLSETNLNWYSYGKPYFTKETLHEHLGNAIYHFHDTSDTAAAKGVSKIDDAHNLKEDAANLGAFLYFLQERHPFHFRRIEAHIRQIAPFFDKFQLRPSVHNPEQIRLEWTAKGASQDTSFNAHDLSDGTLRMICLLTLLLQPKIPNVVIIDEPELGLHPKAISLLAGLVKSVSKEKQIILATQSVALLDEFAPEDVLVVDKIDNQSVIRRLEQAPLQHWLEDYSLGTLWEKNILGGRS
jgi:predicted ATPase